MNAEQSEQFARFWTKAAPTVSTYVHAMLPNLDQAEDVLQDISVAALRKFEQFDAGKPFIGWVMGIARYEILHSRRSFARSLFSTHGDLDETIAQAAGDLADDLTMDRAMLRNCVDAVDGRSKDILRLRYQEDLKPHDIATHLKLSANNVRVILARIREALERCIEKRKSAMGGE